MNKELNNRLADMMPSDDLGGLLELLNLPDAKFNQVYPQLRAELEGVFSSKQFQNEILTRVQSQKNLNAEEERVVVNEILKEIEEDTELSENKKEMLTFIIKKSFLTILDMAEVPRERVEIKIAPINPNAKLPTYAHPTDAGADIYAVEDITIEPGKTEIVKTGLTVEIPVGYAILIYPRSGLSLKTGLRIANSVGVIDSDYRGEIGVLMHNTDGAAAQVKSGDKIAQMVLTEVPMIKWVEVDSLNETDRGEGGFGSTDIKS